METVVFVLAIILLALPLVDWTASIILYKAKNRAHSKILSLNERSKVAIILALATTINGILGLNSIVTTLTGFRLIPQPMPVLILGLSLILVSVPNMYWLYLYSKNRLH